LLNNLNNEKMTDDQVIQVQKVVNNFVVDRITEMIEDMSSNDFIERIMVTLEEEGVKLNFDDEELFEEVKDVVGEKVIPLIMGMSELVFEDED